ncbi:hypothetical protein VTO42DRAFT_3875 [Malbranchea cinnamomea]
MAKRKRANAGNQDAVPRKAIKSSAEIEATSSRPSKAVTIQIVTGSYERILHGVTATITKPLPGQTSSGSVEFADSFLFHAHASAIRCLALSPISNAGDTPSQNIVLASGSTDQRVNLYSLSISPPVVNEKFPSVPTLAGNKVLENPKNRELGSLMHHSSTITALCFPTRSKLLAASEDNTISVIKTRDWSVVSTIKAPRPKVQGRPSGDTAPPGTGPVGINDFAVHPSMKLMLSVGRGEKCMRLWNLVTGKKAGVLNFKREILDSVKESKWSTGEGRKITWDSRGEEFAVAFERGVVVFGIDSEPRCRILPSPLTKIHHIAYLDIDLSDEGKDEVLAVSTERGEILFYDTKKGFSNDPACPIPMANARCQLGGKSQGQTTRIKDFDVLRIQGDQANQQDLVIVTCSSDGAIKLWCLHQKELCDVEKKSAKQDDKTNDGPRQVGRLLGTYETGDRITCLKAFVMAEPNDDVSEEESEFAIDNNGEEEEDSSSDSDSE